MTDNMLGVYPHLMARLRTLPELYAVQGIRELSQMLESRHIVPQHNTLYVVLDGWQPENTPSGSLKKMRLSFSFILAQQFYGDSEAVHEIENIGNTLTHIRRTLQGWQPKETRNGREIPILVERFNEVAPADIHYFDHFALYPLRFETTTL